MRFDSTDPTYPAYPIFAFLGFLLPLIPLPWHLQAWNSGTCYYVVWASLACLNQFVNSVVWAGNALNQSPIWCDISTRIIMGASVGLPAASLCINRRLYSIARVQVVTFTRSDKRRAILIDSLICVLFPLVYVAIQFIIQGHRFNIFEDIGCYPALISSIPSFFLSTIWPVVIGLISAVYCGLTLRAFVRRRAQFNQFLSSNTSLSSSRYFRLMALAMTEICLTTPIGAFVIWLNANSAQIQPWRGIEDAHFEFSRVEQFPAIVWRQQHLVVISIELTRWATPTCGILFFLYFGFAEEAKKNYKALWRSIAGRLGYKVSSSSYSGSAGIASIGHFKKQVSPATLSFPDKALPTPPPYAPSTSHFADIKESKCSYDPTISTMPESPGTASSSSPSRFREHVDYKTRPPSQPFINLNIDEGFDCHSIISLYASSSYRVEPPSSAYTASETPTTSHHLPVSPSLYSVQANPSTPSLHPPTTGALLPSPTTFMLPPPPARRWSRHSSRPLTFPYPQIAKYGINDPDPENFSG